MRGRWLKPGDTPLIRRYLRPGSEERKSVRKILVENEKILLPNFLEYVII